MLSKRERKLIAEIWEKLTPVAEDIGSDALLRECVCHLKLTNGSMVQIDVNHLSSKEALLKKVRMFASFPGTKTYFSHLDISSHSAHLLSHGKKIVLAIAEGAKDISQLTVTLAPLQTFHAYQLRIDPSNFKLFSHCMLVTLACHMGDDFTPVAHAAMDKYLSAFAAVLAEKYR